MKISLIYLDFPFWRAEVSRLALFIGNIDFKDLRISLDEFKRVKEKGELDDGTIIPFHQLPCLTVDGISIAQSGGIARFCGKLTNLYPKDNNIIAARIDQFIDIITDITVMIISTNIENRNETFLRDIYRKLSILNKSLDNISSYAVGNNLSIADICIWSFICWLTGGKIEGVPKNIINKYKNIYKVCIEVDKHPKVNEWIEKTFPKNYARNFS